MLTIESEYFKAHDGLGRAVKWSRRTLFRRDSGALTPTRPLSSHPSPHAHAPDTHTHTAHAHTHTHDDDKFDA